MKELYRYFTNPQTAIDLERLHPGEDREKLRRDYYTAKLKKTLLIAVAGGALAILLAVRAGIERKIDTGIGILREDSAGSTQTLKLETVVGEMKEQFQIRVLPVQLSEEEAEVCYREFRDRLPQLILGKNISLSEVDSDLELAEAFEGYPFLVEWKSSDVDAVTSMGTVRRAEEEQEAILTADITYGDYEWEEQLQVKLLPAEFTAEERQHRDLETFLLESERDSRGEEQWNLPDNWQGEALVWTKVVQNYSLLLGGGALIVAVVVFFLADKDLHEEVEKRKKRMKLEYPDIVHKIALYLGAGLTLRGAFQKVAAEYEQGKRSGKPPGAAYEEMLYACRELQAGISEVQAYEHFGKRTGLQEYIRLTTLMAQNLKKGSNTLIGRLQEEADRASLERIRIGRKLGEEAATKLLVPMVMMLAVVMVMVMLPALTSMGG